MNIHQHVLPTITITITNVSVLGSQAMNPNRAHIAVLVIY
jgi:hypothetical protein